MPEAPSTPMSPLLPKPKVAATLRVPPPRLCPEPLTVVLSVPATASRSIEWAAIAASWTSMLALTPSSVVVMPRTLVPLSLLVALKVRSPPPRLTLDPESTLI